MEVRLLVSSQASVVVGNLHDECIFAFIMMGVGRGTSQGCWDKQFLGDGGKQLNA